MAFIAPDTARVDPPPNGTERATLEAFLDYHRDTLLMKCANLREKQLKHPSVNSSTLSLLGLIRHLSDVEYWWFGENVAGADGADLPYYGTETDTRADLRDAALADSADAFVRYRAAVDFARSVAASRRLDHTFEHHRMGTTSLRWVYLHMIEEYARHNGHADFIREAIDGVTGE